MKTKILLALLIPLQGCAVIGMALDDTLGINDKENHRGQTFTQIGAEIDVEVAKHAVTGESKFTKKQAKGCDDLKGSKKTECLNAAQKISESIKKHTKSLCS